VEQGNDVEVAFVVSIYCNCSVYRRCVEQCFHPNGCKPIRYSVNQLGRKTPHFPKRTNSEAVTDYFETVKSQIQTTAFNLSTIDATKRFIPGFNNYANERGQIANRQAKLSSYYDTEFAGKYLELNNKSVQGSSGILSKLGDTALSLQYDFIANSSFPLGEKDSLVAVGNGTEYAKVHSEYHANFRHFLQEFGYYDIFIADVDTGNIVYSVFKELDFATSVKNGPYADTGIGEVYKRAASATTDEVFISSFEPYLPSYDALAGFAATPIIDKGKTIGVLIFQMPLDRISRLLTHGKKWQEKGFGLSGETYLTTPAGVLLTESRFFLEDQAGYIKAIENKYPAQAKEINSRGTSVGIQPVESLTSKQALMGKSGFEVVKDYRGVEVFSAFYPVKIGQQTMALLAEVDVDEALKPARDLRNSLVSSTVGISVALLAVSILIALWLTATLVRPLTRLGKVCDSLATGNGDLTIQLKADNIPEINRIVGGFNIFIAQIRDIVAQIKVNADTLASASEELSLVTKSTGEKTTLQRDQTHMVATAMQQLSEAVDDVSKSTVRTSDRSLGAQKSLKENMERADMAAQNIKLLVKLIDDSSKVIGSLKNEVNQITSVLNVITSIADQTNLLALNAAIEAARAGEAGRGFSVVADEVRALAIRSQESTVEISKLVEVMNQSAAKSVHSMERATAAADGGIHLVDLVTVAMDELAANLRQVMELTESVASATEEQNQTSNSVVKSVQQISDLSADVELGSQQIKQAAQSLAETAAQTHALVERFKV